jgi:hypothetical protein
LEAAAGAGAEFCILVGERGDYEGCEGGDGGQKEGMGIKEKMKSCEIDWIRVDTPSCVRWHEKRRGRGFFPVLIIIVITVRYGPIRH